MSPPRPWRAARIASAAWLAVAPGAHPAPAAAAEAVVEGQPQHDAIAAHVAAAAQRFGLPRAWIYAVIRAESDGDPRATSRAGAMGLMQIMPRTWADLRVRHGLGDDPYDPRDSILAGAAYMRELFDLYGAPGFLAAYNAGPGRYEDSLATGRPLPAETRAYLAKLAPIVGPRRGDGAVALRPDPVAWRRSALFPGRPDIVPGGGHDVDDPHLGRPSAAGSETSFPVPAADPGGLFVRLSSASSGR